MSPASGAPLMSGLLLCIEPWLPGCGVLPGRVAGYCRVLPGVAGSRGAAGRGAAGGAAGVLPGVLLGCQAVRTCGHLQVLPGAVPGAAGCCRQLPAAAGSCRGPAGSCRVLPGRCRVVAAG